MIVASAKHKGSLDDPTSRFGLERPNALRAGNDFNRPLAQISDGIEQLRATIDTSGEDVAQVGEQAADDPQQRDSVAPILFFG